MYKVSQFRYRLDTLIEGVQVIDFNWRYVYLNEIATQQAKLSKENLLGYTMMEKYPGIEKTAMFGYLEKCMAQRTSHHMENEFFYPDQTSRFFDIRVVPDDDGICILSLDITDAKKAEVVHLEQEQKFRHILGNMIEGVQIHGFDWRYIYVNDALVNFSTYTREELLGFTVMEKYPGIEQTELFKVMQRCMTERVFDKLETEFTFPNGTTAHFELSIEPIPEGIFILSVDRTEQNNAKEKLLKANRLYSFISAINQSIVHINNEKDLLHNACKVATEIGGFKIAWIGMFNFETKTINLVAQNGIPKKELYLFSDMLYPENGLQGYVLSTGSYYNCDDIACDPKLEAWMPFADKHGVHSGIVLPIRKAGSIIGTFNLYSQKTNFADEQEIGLLLEIIGDISFALDNFEKTKNHNKTEALVIANEKRFRALIEKSPDMKTMSNEKGELLYGSPAVTKTLGYESDEFLGTSIMTYIHPDDRLEFIYKRQSILNRPGESFHFHYPLLHKNASWIWCEGTVTNMMHEAGVNAFVANFMDVSEKKAAEQQKEFDQNNLDALINNTNDLMWSVDTDLNLITSNQPFDEMTLHLYSNVIEKGHNIFEGSSSTQTDRFKKLYLRAFSGETFTEIEYNTNPVEYYSEISYYPIRKGNDIIGTACHSRDITEMKKLESQLLKSEIFNREVLNSLSANIAVIDSEGNIVAVNEAWKRFGQENGRTVFNDSDEQNYFEVCAKSSTLGNANATEVLIGLKDVMHNKKSQFYLEYACHSPIKQRWFAMLAKPFQGNEQLVVVAHQDISERKSAQEELIRNNQELLKTNFELDRFVYSVSHDLRSPLTSILGLATFIENETKETDTLQHAGMIKSRINRLDDFIKNILSYSRNSRTDLEVEKIDLGTTAKETVESLCNMKDAEGIRFDIKIDEDIPFYSDKRSLVAVMENLISNAIKFHDPLSTGNTITITAKTYSDKLHLCIADNGIGIAPENHEKIFDMFVRLSSKVEGSGIGLYIAREIIQKLHGTITIDSNLGNGTAFNIILKNLNHEN